MASRTSAEGFVGVSIATRRALWRRLLCIPSSEQAAGMKGEQFRRRVEREQSPHRLAFAVEPGFEEVDLATKHFRVSEQ
jgi:hypothetical protein